MKLPRFNLAGAMTFVAVVALNLGAVRALYDDIGEHLLLDALPTANVLAAVAFAGFRHRRAFAIGFVLAGAMSLLAYQVWADNDPWTVLRYLKPPFEALDRLVGTAFPDLRLAIVNVIGVVAFAVPHAIVGIAGGGLAAKGMAMARRRKERRGIVPTVETPGGLPIYLAVGAADVGQGMLAAWQPNHPDHPEGVILLNVDHPVLRSVIEHWQLQYADHHAELIKNDVIDAYG
jgi:hypothetical protein